MRNLSSRNKIILAVVAAIVLLLIGFAACGGGDDDTVGPTTENTPESGGVVALDPMLTAVTAPVQYRVTETDSLTDVDPGSSVEIAPGANMVVGQNGVGKLTWSGFLENELLTGADSLLSLSLPSEYEAILDQAAGTAVYRVLDFGLGEDGEQRSDEGHRLQVIAGWVTVDVVEAPSETIVSFIPGDAPAAWVISRSGSASVTRCVDDNPADCETIELSEGQAAAFTKDGDLPEPRDIDTSRVGIWLDEVRGGTATGSIASAAFRCALSADAQLYELPDDTSDPVGDPLTAGTVVAASERDESGQWVLVETLLGGDEGWVSADALDCVGPIDNLPVSVEEGQPTNTPVPLPTRVPVIIPTVPTGTITPTPTATPGLDASISFTASEGEIAPGECTTLKWTVENIKAVWFDGEGVTGSGSRKKCPTKETTYTLKVELLDGTIEEKSITIKVKTPDATDTPEPTNTPVPAATNTTAPTAPPAATDFPVNTPVPTAEPTAVPPTATDPPPPTATDPPPPTATDPPPPTATDPLPPDPTVTPGA